MISSRLVEIVFSRLWLVLLPVILVPAMVISLAGAAPKYTSTASVWVGLPLGTGDLPIGHTNPYLTPAQNQAIVINDLLATESFLREVLTAAGSIEASATSKEVSEAMRERSLTVNFQGVNLMTLEGSAPGAEEARLLVAATIDTFLVRAEQQLQQDADAASRYYSQQVSIAEGEFEERKAALNAYLAEHPDAADPRNPASYNLDYRTLVDRVTTQANVVEDLNKSVQAVQLTMAANSDGGHSYFEVQDAPVTPTTADAVSVTARFGLPLAAMIFGICISAAIVFIRYRADHTIRSSSDLKTLGVPVLGFVPEIRPGGLASRIPPLRAFIAWRQRDYARITARALANQVSLPEGRNQ